MKINEVMLNTNSTVITEALGTLSQLNAGNLINVLKQNAYSPSKKYGGGPTISSDAASFKTRAIGSESEIVDAGKINSIADIRKAFKNAENPAGFALYIGNDAVALGVTDAYNLAGASRVNAIAWDFTKFKEQFSAALEKINADKIHATRKTQLEPTSARDKEERDYSVPWNYSGSAPTKTVKYTGTAKTTAELATLTNVASLVAQEAGQQLGGKIILTDMAAREKRSSRQQIQYELSKTGDDLRTRVAKYKLSKRPTANNIQEFIDAVMKQKLNVIQFAGSAYALAAESDKVDINNLMRGVPFKASYRSSVPGQYDSIYITYVYTKNGGIVPIFASYTDRQNNQTKTVNEVLDPVMYAKRVLKVKDPTDKTEVIKRLLTLLKEQKFKVLATELKVFQDIGNDWPELAVIEKSMNAELAKKDQQV